MRRKPGRGPRGDQRWRTFLRNHAAAIVACDFCVAVTASFRVLYIFVIIEHASRRLLHWNVTSNPTATWTLQQLREAIASDHPYRFLVHDRDSIYTQALDTSIANLRLRVLKTPLSSAKNRIPRSWPKPDGICGMIAIVMPAARIFLQLIADFVVYLGLLIRPRKAIAAENLFLRRQLALYQERKVDPRRIDPATRITLALLSRLFNWRDALVVVQPKTLIRWHRAGFRLLWHWKSKPGRPPIPAELRRLIREMSRDNSLWGEERIANELLVKLGISVSPRTVRKYMPKEARPRTSRRSALADVSAQSLERPSSPAISVWRSRRGFAFYTSL